MAEIISDIGTGGQYATVGAWLAASGTAGNTLSTTGGSVTVSYAGSNVYVGRLLESLSMAQSGTAGFAALELSGAPTTATSHRILRLNGFTLSGSFSHQSDVMRMTYVRVGEAFSIVEGGDITATLSGSGVTPFRCVLLDTADAVLRRCRIRGLNGGASGVNVRGVVAASGSLIYRNRIFNLQASGTRNARAVQSFGVSKVLNNTIHDIGDRGIDASVGSPDTQEQRNNLVTNCGTCIVNGGTGTHARSGNMTSDATGDAGLINVVAANQYVNATAPYDLNLKAGANAVDAGVNIGATYPAVAIDFNGTTVSGAWDIGSSELVAGGGVGTITDLFAQPGDNQVGLLWSPAADATAHAVHRSTSSPVAQDGSHLLQGGLGASAANYTDATAVNGTQYFYKVAATDGTNTTWSNEVSATPAATVYKVSGTVTRAGSPQAGANVRLIDMTDDVQVGEVLTDASGSYEFLNLDSTHLYHAAVEYETGGTKYHAPSQPYLVPTAV